MAWVNFHDFYDPRMLKFGNFIGVGGLIKEKINHENFITLNL